MTLKSVKVTSDTNECQSQKFYLKVSKGKTWQLKGKVALKSVKFQTVKSKSY